MLATMLVLTGVLLGSWPKDRDALPFYCFLAFMIAIFYLMHEKVGIVILGLFMLATLTPGLVRNLRGLI